MDVHRSEPPREAAPSVERGAGVTLWRQIEQALEAEIAGGRIPPGGRLPTEQQLSARFQVNRHTVRRAMEELERRGLVRIQQGRGSFAAEDVIDYQVGPRTRFSEVIARQNREPSGRILRVAEVVADEAAAAALRLRRGRMLWLVERLGLADGRPVSLGRHHFPQTRLPGLPDALADGKGSITRALAACGVVEYARRSTRVTARLPSLEEAEALAHPRNRPVIVTEAVNIDAQGVPVEYGVATYPAGRVQLNFEF
ncbi:phosphonate metabolism transcriptional regulator PhnF [Elioraea tepidiphila]|jgi:GntR family phosphonate transport system transcriptional regulator|uniref:phosphonate metabolism transcriptional regulator PhnF n=1 Tax=Elioraea tepidiphila TaxID=457934 RepID=UPI0006862FDF|nr:phosphonate metabolism transcriptional regulator PhnF [Elioraea tepidiphila]